MTLTTFDTTSHRSFASREAARIASAKAAATGIGATLSAMGAAASDGVSATLSLSGNALKVLAEVGESAVEGVIDGSTSLSSAASTVLGSAEDLAVGVWNSARDAAVGVEQLAESGWAEVKAGIASVEHAGGSMIAGIVSGLDDVESASRSTASAIGHYAGVALDAADEVLSGVTLGSGSLLAVL